MSAPDTELMARMCHDLPDSQLHGLRLEHFTVEGTIEDLLVQVEHYGPERVASPGRYLRLVEDDPTEDRGWRVWMSNTQAELADHLPVMRVVEAGASSVLINGLGIGAVLAGVLSFGHVTQVDVVELDLRVLDLVAHHYEDDPRVRFHHEDALAVEWLGDPTTIRWDAVWHDIWPSIHTGNARSMYDLWVKYRHRTDWQGWWSLPQALAQWRVVQGLHQAIRDS